MYMVRNHNYFGFGDTVEAAISDYEFSYGDFDSSIHEVFIIKQVNVAKKYTVVEGEE